MKVFLILNIFFVYETLCVNVVRASPSGGSLMMTNTFTATDQNTNTIHDHNNLAISRRETKEIQRLRLQIDKMSLKQKMDKIKIEILNKKMGKMEKYFETLLNSKSVVKLIQNDLKLSGQNILRNSQEELQEPLGTPFEQKSEDEDRKKFEQKVLEKFERKEQIFSEEIKYIREEFLKLKENCSKCGSKPSKVVSREVRDHSSLEWVMQIIPSLQNSVQELQQSTDVVKALHEKQDIGTKLDLVIEDAKKQQKSLIKLTSFSEATSATIKTLSEEFKETSSRIYEAESSLIHLKTELEDEKSSMEELLKALPDGFLSRKPNAVQIPLESSISLGDATTPQGMTSGPVENIIVELQEKISSLDFALMNMQKKVFFNVYNISANNKSESSNENCGSDLSNRVNEIEFELSKMKDSSKAVLDFMSEFDKRNGKSIKGVDTKLSIVETQIEKEIEDRTFHNIDTKSDIIDTKSEIRDDYVELKNDISNLRIKLKSYEDSINRSKKSNIDNNQFFLSKFNESCLEIIRQENVNSDQKVTNIEKRLKMIERKVSKNSKFLHKRKRHKHGLVKI